MHAIDRRIAEQVSSLTEGTWNAEKFRHCIGLHGRTLGVMGFESVGQQVTKVARSMGMNVMVNTDNQIPGLDEELGCMYVSQDQLLAKSDIVAVLTAFTSQKEEVSINTEFLKRIRSDAMLINTSPYIQVDEEALLAKLEACPNFWVGTDIYNEEPRKLVQENFNNKLA